MWGVCVRVCAHACGGGRRRSGDGVPWSHSRTRPLSQVWHQYEVVGRHKPTDKDRHPAVYRMKIFAPNTVIARSRFWYFLGVINKVKKQTGEILEVHEVRRRWCWWRPPWRRRRRSRARRARCGGCGGRRTRWPVLCCVPLLSFRVHVCPPYLVLLLFCCAVPVRGVG